MPKKGDRFNNCFSGHWACPCLNATGTPVNAVANFPHALLQYPGTVSKQYLHVCREKSVSLILIIHRLELLRTHAVPIHSLRVVIDQVVTGIVSRGALFGLDGAFRGGHLGPQTGVFLA
jgi:hypothetical protein